MVELNVYVVAIRTTHNKKLQRTNLQRMETLILKH